MDSVARTEAIIIISSDYTPMGWANAGSGTYRYLVEYEDRPSDTVPSV